MSFSRWIMTLGLVVGIGMLITAQRIAVFMEGYVVGKRMEQVHQEEASVGWLSHEVMGAASPTALAYEAQQRRMNLVAWSSLKDQPAQDAAADASSDTRDAVVARNDTAD